MKEQYKALTKDEKRIARAKKRWIRLSSIVTYIVFIFCMGVGIYWIQLIPRPSSWLWKTLVVIGQVLLGFILLLVSGFAAMICTLRLWKKAESFHLPTLKKEIFSKACHHLRGYYGLQEPYIITKCFDATNNQFKNHDVCIFVADDELRITTDLIRGFLHGERDLGCYAFKREEIALIKRQEGNHLILELKADKTVFLLGYRAKSFIEKNFTAKQSN